MNKQWYVDYVDYVSDLYDDVHAEATAWANKMEKEKKND